MFFRRLETKLHLEKDGKTRSDDEDSSQILAFPAQQSAAAQSHLDDASELQPAAATSNDDTASRHLF